MIIDRLVYFFYSFKLATLTKMVKFMVIISIKKYLVQACPFHLYTVNEL